MTCEGFISAKVAQPVGNIKKKYILYKINIMNEFVK